MDDLKKVVDPLIYPHVKILNQLGIGTEYSCAGTGQSIVYNDDEIILKKTHKEHPLHFPYIITSNKLDYRCNVILGSLMFFSPEIFYCEKHNVFFGDRFVKIRKKCPCYKQIPDLAQISQGHKGYRLIDVSRTYFNRAYIGVDRNMDICLHGDILKAQDHIALISRLFLKHLLLLLKKIQKAQKGIICIK